MGSLARVLRRLPWTIRFVRWRSRAVRKGAKRLGAGLAPLEHRLDEIEAVCDWLDAHGASSRPRILVAVWLLRESERYDAFHESVLDVIARRERLSRLSSTFTPMQRSRYRPVIRALAGFEKRLSALDDLLSAIVRHPNEVSDRLGRMVRFSAATKVRGQRIRYAFDPSGAMLFGDGMESYIDRIFAMGLRAFKKRVRAFIDDALAASLPEGALDRFDGNVRIDISSVSGTEQSTEVKGGVVLSINAITFLRSVFEEDTGAFLELIGASHDSRTEAAEIDDRVLVEIREHAISSLDSVWKAHSLGQEYAGVLSIERLELPSHTGSFPDLESFVRYAEHKVEEGVRSYFARNVGLHIAWTLVCDRFGQYRPIGTAAIRELSGREHGDGIMRKILAEMRGTDPKGLFARYIHACERLTRAPLVSNV